MPRQDSKRRFGAPALALAIGALAGLALLAAPTRAARLVAVRVAQHHGFARVVFESDAPAAFDVEPPHGSGPVRVQLDASCTARSVSARGAPELSVQLEPGPEGGCIAVVSAAGPLRIEAQVLDRPPRAVLDLAPASDAALAPAANQETPTVQPPEPSERPHGPALPTPPETPTTQVAAPEQNPVAEAPAEPPSKAAAVPEAPAPTPPSVASPPASAPAPPAREPVSSPSPPPRQPSGSSSQPSGSSSQPSESSRQPAPSGPVGWDVRSLGVGLALGVLLGLLGSVASRPRPAARLKPTAGAPLAVEIAPLAKPAPAPIAPPEPVRSSPTDAQLLSDLLTMFQGIDRRLASIESGSDATRALCERLVAREAAHGEELAAQRVALTRLDRALRRPPLRASGSARSLPR